MPLARTPDHIPESAPSDLLDRSGVELLDAGIPADRPVRAGGRPRTVELTEQFYIPDERLEQVLAFLLDCAPHLIASADLDPLRGIVPGDSDVTAGAVTCTALGPLREDGTRSACTRGLHPAAWDHLAGNGREITDSWAGDYR